MANSSIATAGSSLNSRLESLNSEYQICRRKLESKCEALLILSKELDQCRSERDQFKLMAEQLRDRYQMVKRQLTGDTPVSPTNLEMDPKTYSNTQTQSLARLLFDTKESNKSLKFEVDDLKQKLLDAEGDIKLLREQIVRSRVGTTDEGLNTRHFPAHEREDLVKQLEASREEYVQLERDLQQVIDEKEELVTERDTYRTKYERLNTELNYILRGDEKRIVDIDALSMENKFLQERIKQMDEEKSMAIATVTKYKSILEKKKTKGIARIGQSRSGGLVITQKQGIFEYFKSVLYKHITFSANVLRIVHQILQSGSSISPTPQALADLQGLCRALLDTINDKNLALSHQRKTNKLLGNRVNELEKKLKTLEVSGLWSVSGNHANLEKLKAECEEIKTLVPRQFSQSTENSDQPTAVSDLESELSSSVSNSTSTSPMHQPGLYNRLSRLDLEELDLLPTKEEVVKGGPDKPPVVPSHPPVGAVAVSQDNAATTPTFLDSNLGVSGSSGGSHDVEALNDTSTAEDVLQSLLQYHHKGPPSGPRPSESELLGKVGVQKYIEDSDSEDNCPDFLQSYLDKHTVEIAASEGDASEGDNNWDDRDVDDDEVTNDKVDNDNDNEAEMMWNEDIEDEEEANKQFKVLMESVTSKLLEQSQNSKGKCPPTSQDSPDSTNIDQLGASPTHIDQVNSSLKDIDQLDANLKDIDLPGADPKDVDQPDGDLTDSGQLVADPMDADDSNPDQLEECTDGIHMAASHDSSSCDEEKSHESLLGNSGEQDVSRPFNSVVDC